MAMAVHRGKNFIKRTWRNNWSGQGDKKIGYNLKTLRCYNCHEPGHFAKHCKNPTVNKVGAAAGNSSSSQGTSAQAGNNMQLV
ncbi:MAG: C2HC-type zinc finger protein, partial [Candidatus Phytoplasma australasiaticum]|nr:C2HC-type zinc finger protein [Candidatus Phytoplasma australasiaticum]